MTIVFRNDDTRWGLGTGAGVGGRVTSLQADENNYQLDTRLTAVEADLDGLDMFVTYNGSSVTFTFSNGTISGPFPLPVAMINPVGEWQPNTHYNYLDLFNVRAQGVFLVLLEHTSDSTFDPDATDGSTDNLPLYQLWAPLRDLNYDICLSITGNIDGATSPELLAQIVSPRSLSMAAGLPGGYAFLETPTDSEELVLSILKNGAEIGTITFTPGTNSTDGGQEGVISFPADVDFDAGDRIGLLGPTSTDLLAADLSVTLPATRTDL